MWVPRATPENSEWYHWIIILAANRAMATHIPHIQIIFDNSSENHFNVTNKTRKIKEIQKRSRTFFHYLLSFANFFKWIFSHSVSLSPSMIIDIIQFVQLNLIDSPSTVFLCVPKLNTIYHQKPENQKIKKIQKTVHFRFAPTRIQCIWAIISKFLKAILDFCTQKENQKQSYRCALNQYFIIKIFILFHSMFTLQEYFNFIDYSINLLMFITSPTFSGISHVLYHHTISVVSR